jgi:hypothetical protein
MCALRQDDYGENVDLPLLRRSRASGTAIFVMDGLSPHCRTFTFDSLNPSVAFLVREE